MATFKVICVPTGEDCRDDDGNLLTFPDGETAAAYARAHTEASGMKYQPRRFKSTGVDWRKRENKRFYDGSYRPVPWEGEDWWRGSDPDLNHFAHVSIDNGAKVAFTPDVQHGEDDRQIRIKPGAYLQRFFGHDIDMEDIRYWASVFSSDFDELEFGLARTPAMVRKVYELGPESCMSHHADNFDSGKQHPCEVYAGPDLAVAYLKLTSPDTQEDEEGNEREVHYSARCLVWPEKKIYGRIYGDEGRLRALLEREGYKPGKLTGARIRRVVLKENFHMYHEDRELGVERPLFVLPYIDNVKAVKDAGKYLVIDPNGHIDATGTGGNGHDQRPACNGCRKLESDYEQNNLYSPEAGENRYFCTKCVPSDQITRESMNGRTVRRSDVIEFDDSAHRYLLRDLENELMICPKLNMPFWRRTGVTMVDGTRVSSAWFKAAGKMCGTCGLGLPRSGDVKVCDQYGKACPQSPGHEEYIQAEKKRIQEVFAKQQKAYSSVGGLNNTWTITPTNTGSNS